MRVHFIGIAGTGMGALARLMKEAGHEVRGSDMAVYPPMSDQLAAAQIPVMLGFSADNLGWGPEAVVVGNVCRRDHVEAVAAQAQGIPLESFPSMLARALLPGRRSLVVAGTHGKTTTAGLAAWLFEVGGREPSYLIGGVPINFGRGAHLGAGEVFIIEGDEYDTAFFDKGSKFLHYQPQRAIITGVEFDHADIFADLAAVRAAFAAFVAKIPPSGQLVVHRDDPEAMGVAASAACEVTTYAVLPDGATDLTWADYCAIPGPLVPQTIRRFEVFERGHSLGQFSTQLVGRYNLGNVLAAIALGRAEGVELEGIRAAVRQFRGVKRRQEFIGMAQGVRVISDFAHHPTAVNLTVTAVRKKYPDQALHVCFEPRSASSRRRAFGEAFATGFDAATAVYVGPLYHPENIPEAERLDTVQLARAIAARGVPARAYDDVDTLARDLLDVASSGDTILMLTSGSFDGLAEKLLLELGDPVTFSSPEDAPAVQALLSGYRLPEILPASDVETMVLRSSIGLVGCVSLLTGEHSGLLFGLAVHPERRGQGLGWVLGDSVLRRARELALSRVYLLASTAADFFAAKLGFSPVALDSVDPAIRHSPNFVAAAAQPNAVCMCMSFGAPHPRQVDENLAPS